MTDLKKEDSDAALWLKEEMKSVLSKYDESTVKRIEEYIEMNPEYQFSKDAKLNDMVESLSSYFSMFIYDAFAEAYDDILSMIDEIANENETPKDPSLKTQEDQKVKKKLVITKKDSSR